MATVKEIQAELDAQGTANKINLVKQSRTPAAATAYDWYVTGGVIAPGKAGWVQSTVADNAATQAAAITTATLALYP